MYFKYSELLVLAMLSSGLINERFMQAWLELFYEILDQKFNFNKDKNSRYSVRAFAKKAKVSASAMSALLRRGNDWTPSKERALEILRNVGVSPQQISHMNLLMGEAVEVKRKTLPSQDHPLLTDLCYFPVLLSFELGGNQTAPAIAARFGLAESQVQEIIADLISRGYLEKFGDGIRKIEPMSWRVPDGPINEYIMLGNQKIADLIYKSAQRLTPDERDFVSLTVSGNSQQIAEIKKEVRLFYDRVQCILDSSEGEKNEVFKIFTGVIPLSVAGKKGLL